MLSYDEMGPLNMSRNENSPRSKMRESGPIRKEGEGCQLDALLSSRISVSPTRPVSIHPASSRISRKISEGLISNPRDHLGVDECDLQERHRRVSLITPERALHLNLGADHRTTVVDGGLQTKGGQRRQRSGRDETRRARLSGGRTLTASVNSLQSSLTNPRGAAT